ncbi:hypothetical protein EDD36DRAFT_132143 [Exophiala viscosa]|uniref:Uncharacterized protein n=1 Tax=Exophiala viscosa TaxID=2486360 RepID=A0AAN6IGM0_9EURO|nr:hypothetical protein EDD36DRAFT_132143 [Exophiala viscosa]
MLCFDVLVCAAHYFTVALVLFGRKSPINAARKWKFIHSSFCTEKDFHSTHTIHNPLRPLNPLFLGPLAFLPFSRLVSVVLQRFCRPLRFRCWSRVVPLNLVLKKFWNPSHHPHQATINRRLTPDTVQPVYCPRTFRQTSLHRDRIPNKVLTFSCDLSRTGRRFRQFQGLERVLTRTRGLSVLKTREGGPWRVVVVRLKDSSSL